VIVQALSSSLVAVQMDVLYLHNAAESQVDTLGEAKFMQRLRDAFVWLEDARQHGRIQSYGMVSEFRALAFSVLRLAATHPLSAPLSNTSAGGLGAVACLAVLPVKALQG
jgi:diketogulonate reductase-like aldo/keto reductase